MHMPAEASVTSRARGPKKMTDATAAGAMAMSTLRMTDCVVSGLVI